VHNKNKSYITPQHTRNTRLLCECELYTSIYDNDTEMKAVMGNYNQQTSQRFEEYNKRMNKNKQKCKDECDKEIQKIILKDKLQKELMHKFATLHTDIQSDAIPTCVCEKSLADKVEKGCLMCGCGLGGGVAPVWGLVSGLWYATLSQYISAKVVEEGIKKGLEVGLSKIMIFAKTLNSGDNLPTITVTQLFSSGNFSNDVTLFDIVHHINNTMYNALETGGYENFCFSISSMAKYKNITTFNRNYGQYSTAVTEAFVQAKNSAINALTPATNALTTAIIASIVAIVVIVLVMLIIYLILRYRRKKKMNKKLQYIKLLKE
ncbi:hypothetical protein PFDG_01035, partial [Plasmodium falciparum Dd2]